MAYIEPRKNKQGEIIAYRIRVNKGYDKNGKKLKPYELNFKPDPELLEEMNSRAFFKLIDVDIETPKGSRFSREERLERARTIIRRYGYMTLADYAMATGQSKSAASKDLNRLVKDPDSGIIARGENSHKIWVDSKARL